MFEKMKFMQRNNLSVYELFIDANRALQLLH